MRGGVGSLWEATVTTSSGNSSVDLVFAFRNVVVVVVVAAFAVVKVVAAMFSVVAGGGCRVEDSRVVGFGGGRGVGVLYISI